MSLRHLALALLLSTVSVAAAQAVNPWDDPVGRAAIDEWLVMARLTPWGQWEGRSRTATIRVDSTFAGDEEQRHKLVYRQAQRGRANTNITLADYVAQRMAGGHPAVIYTPPTGHIPR